MRKRRLPGWSGWVLLYSAGPAALLGGAYLGHASWNAMVDRLRGGYFKGVAHRSPQPSIRAYRGLVGTFVAAVTEVGRGVRGRDPVERGAERPL